MRTPTLGRAFPFLLLLSLSTVGLRAGRPMEDIAIRPLSQAIYHDTWLDLNKNGKRDPYEDSRVAIERRIEDLLGRMTVEEKTCQLCTLYGFRRVLQDDLPTDRWKSQIWKDGIANIDEHINGVAKWRGKAQSPHVWPASQHARAINEVQRWFVEETRLGIPVDFTNEGIRGIAHHRGTNFPAQVGVGATWNRELVRKIGQVTGREGRVLGYTTIYSPILDLARDPRWGRVVECYGEDPWLVSELGIQQARGLRAEGVGSSPKHYAVYGVPKGGRDGDARTDPHVAPREMEMMYLMPFERLIREADITGVMSSYNDYDGDPVSGSKTLLLDHLRGRMGFRGYVVSDSDAVKFLHSKHRVVASYRDACGLFLEAGGNVRTEFNEPQNFILPVRELIAAGKLSMQVVDDRVRDVLRVKFLLGLFDRPYQLDLAEADRVVHCSDHQQVALQAARESIVLLKNANDVLPLRKDLTSILICGPNARETSHSVSRYGPTMGDVVSVWDGVRAIVSPRTEVKFSEGCKIADERWPESDLLYEPPSGDDARMIHDAVEQSQGVDAIILVLGESEKTVGESKSRTSLNLTGYQRDLARSLHATGKPLVVVLINGRALTVNWIDRHVSALVEAWFPGEWCGRVVAEVLFGDYNPGGKLPVTFPRTVGQVPYNFPAKRGSQAGQGKKNDPNGVGNSRIYGALYPFGHGLSYTTFAYENLRVQPAEVLPTGSVTVTCKVTNVGARGGDEVVQLYVSDDVSSVVTYEKVLRGFERIYLKPGQSQSLSFQLGPQELELLDLHRKRVVEPGTFTVMVGSSSEDVRLSGTFQVAE